MNRRNRTFDASFLFSFSFFLFSFIQRFDFFFCAISALEKFETPSVNSFGTGFAGALAVNFCEEKKKTQDKIK